MMLNRSMANNIKIYVICLKSLQHLKVLDILLSCSIYIIHLPVYPSLQLNFKTWQICYRVRPNLCRAIWRISSVWLSELGMISWSWVAIDWRSAVLGGVNNRSIFIQQVYCVWLLPGQQQVGYSYWVASHAQRRSLLLQKFCGLCVCLCVSLSIVHNDELC